MGVDFYYKRISPQKGVHIPAGGRSRVKEVMEEVFGNFPITLGIEHAERIKLMGLASEEEFYKEVYSVLANLENDEKIVISAEY